MNDDIEAAVFIVILVNWYRGDQTLTLGVIIFFAELLKLVVFVFFKIRNHVEIPGKLMI